MTSYTNTFTSDDNAGSYLSRRDQLNGGSTVGGSDTSKVLFCIALVVGCIILVSFFILALRYSFKAKYCFGRNHGSFNGGVVRCPPQDGILTNTTASDGELLEQLEYIQRFHYIEPEDLERHILEVRWRRDRMGEGHYSRMTSLTSHEIDLLFPKKPYKVWLNGGQEDDKKRRNGILQEEDTLLKNDEQVTNGVLQGTGVFNSAETRTGSSSEDNEKQMDLGLDETEQNDMISEKAIGLQFSSGSCVICPENLEQEDSVRGLLCGHVFHTDCLDPWLTTKRACCPICRRNYLLKEDDQLDESHNADSSPSSTRIRAIEYDLSSVGVDVVRNDAPLRVLLRSLIPIEARVRYILEHQNLSFPDIEERAREVTAHKFRNVFRLIWWKIMGISKDDIFNWSVIELHREYTNNALSAPSPQENTSDNFHCNQRSLGGPTTSTSNHNPNPFNLSRPTANSLSRLQSSEANSFDLGESGRTWVEQLV